MAAGNGSRISAMKIQEKGQAYGPASEDRPRLSLRIPPSLLEGSQEHHWFIALSRGRARGTAIGMMRVACVGCEVTGRLY